MMYVEDFKVHRTQVLLKEDQYLALKARARRQGTSLSQLIRAAVDEWLGEPADTASASILEIRALASDPQGPSARDHDAFLYGRARK